MNARQMIAKLDGYGGIIPFNSEELDVTLRALRLLAAAEANDGTTPETDAAEIKIQSGFKEVPTGTAPADFARRIERERNGLAARVRELENECSAADIYGRTSASHGFINAPKWHELADETKSLYRESAARSKP